MSTYRIVTLGCRVNHYESLQIEQFLQESGHIRASGPDADLIILNTCSVTNAAAAKSRNLLRRFSRRPFFPSTDPAATPAAGARTIAIGCWATSDPESAIQIVGPHAVLSHKDNIAAGLAQLIPPATRPDETNLAAARFAVTHSDAAHPHATGPDAPHPDAAHRATSRPGETLPPEIRPDASRLAAAHPNATRPNAPHRAVTHPAACPPPPAVSLPLLSIRQPDNQRAILKIQDGCDAHCTYCIIPSLRNTLSSKPLADVLTEARQLIDAGHQELVLTGIFLGAYGQPTALHRRQKPIEQSLGHLIHTLCTRVPGMRRLRLSSLEPADLTDDLLAVLRSHPQIMPHFHLPLQSGADSILRKMNRQYNRQDYLRMVDRLKTAFDRPAITTDIIVGFPGETDDLFQQTLDLVDQAGFLHIHPFPFSPRQGTAAARWKTQFVHSQTITDRMNLLQDRCRQHSLTFRRQFVGQHVQLMVEHPSADQTRSAHINGLQHGRCERYFPVHFQAPTNLTGQLLQVRITQATPTQTLATPDSALPSSNGATSFSPG